MQSANKFSLSSILLFIIPSLIGLAFFMVPLPTEDGVTIPIALLSDSLQGWIGDYIPAIMTYLIIAAALGTVIVKLFRPAFVRKSAFLATLFDISTVWAVIRVIGAIFAFMALYQVGPEIIHSDVTGGLLLNDLLAILFSTFLFAGLLLPLLLNFGLLEFVGYSLTKIMRPLFKLPGRSSVDCLASWLGDGTIGVLLTSKQYEQGYYTKKEASIVGTAFSVVSVTFCLVVISQVGLERYFIPFYVTVIVSGIIAALILPRIYPLANKGDTFINDDERKGDEESIPSGYSPISYGFEQAVVQAKKNKPSEVVSDSFRNVFDMWLGVAPVVMALGTIALVIAEYTPVFQWLGVPFIPLLELLQIPSAAAASETIMVGFADMFLPAIIGADIESELTRFVIACLSVSQLVYMSEMGGLLLGSKIPVNLKDLIIIFLLRTLITLPIIAAAAHLIF
ncbi:nucleoside recognition membrane protein YjiH [Bacillus ectoiniformans]|uniref:YjiH family protein n=1 Tax=Bacillus ectoiniformans TaxID=1494429 RepID=UPI001958DFB8|nr:YjiH family protein [Bacillus ectoiniformans]MBM7648293.1 nucleoside recognition membrane protein YjiH [Bacillus ectoiniformans]